MTVLYVYLCILPSIAQWSKVNQDVSEEGFFKRYTSKKIPCEVTPTTTDVVHEEVRQLNYPKAEVKSSCDQLFCYQIFQEKYMGEVNKLLLDSLRKKSLERMKASEEYTESDGSDFEETNMVVNIAQDSINSFEINNAYSKLVENSVRNEREMQPVFIITSHNY